MVARKYLKTGEVARLFGVSPRTIVKWADLGALPHHKLPQTGKLALHRRFAVEDVLACGQRMGLPEDMLQTIRQAAA